MPCVIWIAPSTTFAELDTEKAQLEANLFIWSNLQVEGMEKKYKEAALKSFAVMLCFFYLIGNLWWCFVNWQLACKSNLDHRALELVQMLGNPQILNLAVKYASKQNRRLAEKLLEIAPMIGDENGENNSFTSVSSRICYKKQLKCQWCDWLLVS